MMHRLLLSIFSIMSELKNRRGENILQPIILFEYQYYGNATGYRLQSN